MSRRSQILLAAAALASPMGTTFHNLSRSDSVMRRHPQKFPGPKPVCAGEKKWLAQLNASTSKPEPSRKRPATVTARNALEVNSSRMFLFHKCRHASGTPCEVASADFSHPCPAIFPVKHAENCPHDRTPLLIENFDIRPPFQGAFAPSGKWFRAHCSMVSFGTAARPPADTL